MFFSYFRKKYPNARTNHPIFSVVALGKNKDLFLSASIHDCFGENTIFDILYKLNAKIVALGCELQRITFTHYVEQKFGVNYRYFKYFSGDIVSREKILRNVTSRYYVGNLNIKYSLNLIKLKENLLKKNYIKIIPFGRVAAYTVTTTEYFLVVSEMLSLNKYSLIEEGYSE